MTLQRDRLDCIDTYGTHKCSQLFGHTRPHYCVCVKGEQRRWQDGETAPLSAFRPDLINASHVSELRRRKLIK